LGVLLPRQRLVWRAGFGLIVAGIVCLYLSDAVVSGWWQGTLDAFGVGFVVGGIVDVLAISGLNQAIITEQVRRENNREAVLILQSARDGQLEVGRARALLEPSRGQIDPRLRARLIEVFGRDALGGREEWRGVDAEHFDAQEPPAETLGHGDAPQAPGNG
jgi:hypothetical protein